MYSAALRYRNMVWCVGERIYDFVTRLWIEAKHARHTTKHTCVVVTQLPEEVRPAAKAWINEKGEEAITDKAAREFIRLIQDTLKQKGLPLDYGARIAEKTSAKQIKQKLPEVELSSGSSENGETNETVHSIPVEKGRKSRWEAGIRGTAQR